MNLLLIELSKLVMMRVDFDVLEPAVEEFKNAEQTTQMCLKIVRRYPMALQYVNHQTEEICREALRKNGMALRHVRDQTDEICAFAMKRCASAIKCIHKPNMQNYFDAVKYRARAIKMIKGMYCSGTKENRRELTLDQCNSLVMSAIYWHPNEPILKHLSYHQKKRMSDRFLMDVVICKPDEIQWISEPSLSVQLAAVQTDGIVLKYIMNPCKIVCEAAVEQNLLALGHVPINVLL